MFQSLLRARFASLPVEVVERVEAADGACIDEGATQRQVFVD